MPWRRRRASSTLKRLSGNCPCVAWVISLLDSCGGADLASGWRGAAAASGHPARQRGRLPEPRHQLCLVELVVLADVEGAHVLRRGLAGRDRAQRRAAEERHLDV